MYRAGAGLGVGDHKFYVDVKNTAKAHVAPLNIFYYHRVTMRLLFLRSGFIKFSWVRIAQLVAV